MKIKKKAQKAAETAPAAGEVKITVDLFDCHVQYVGRHVPTARIRKESVGLVVPAKLKKGFLVISGDKPATKVSPVMWDGKDRYKRVDDNGKTYYGSLSALNDQSEDHLEAKIVDLDGLLAIARKLKHGVEATRRSDDKTFKVMLLAPLSQTCYAGIYVERGKVRVLNMEPVAPYNSKDIQFTNLKDVPAKPLLAEIEAAA